MAIYKLVMNGEYHGNRVNNILWYRTGLGIDLDGLTIGGAKELVDQFHAVVWPNFKRVLPPEYKLQDISCYPMHDGTFDLLYQNPYTKNIGDSGDGDNNTDGPGVCMILKFNLEPTGVLPNGIFPPKRGYIAVGPLPSLYVDNTGHITNAIFVNPLDNIHKLAGALSENLENLLPPVIFYPIRVSQKKILGLFKVVSFADVSSAAVQRRVSFRRSRLPEF